MEEVHITFFWILIIARIHKHLAPWLASYFYAKLILDHDLELVEAFMDQFEHHKARKGFINN